jgi:hypothetical protein
VLFSEDAVLWRRAFRVLSMKNLPQIIPFLSLFTTGYTDNKENIILIFLIYKKIQMGAVAKSYMRKGFLIYVEMRKYLIIYEEAVNHI